MLLMLMQVHAAQRTLQLNALPHTQLQHCLCPLLKVPKVCNTHAQLLQLLMPSIAPACCNCMHLLACTCSQVWAERARQASLATLSCSCLAWLTLQAGQRWVSLLAGLADHTGQGL